MILVTARSFALPLILLSACTTPVGQASDKPREKLVCLSGVSTGSLISQTACLSAEDWDRYHQQTGDAARRFVDASRQQTDVGVLPVDPNKSPADPALP